MKYYKLITNDWHDLLNIKEDTIYSEDFEFSDRAGTPYIINCGDINCCPNGIVTTKHLTTNFLDGSFIEVDKEEYIKQESNIILNILKEAINGSLNIDIVSGVIVEPEDFFIMKKILHILNYIQYEEHTTLKKWQKSTKEIYCLKRVPNIDFYNKTTHCYYNVPSDAPIVEIKLKEIKEKLNKLYNK